MRALFATAVACLALSACGGQADPLPPGMASRITATGDVFSLAVPAGWSDLTTANGGRIEDASGFHHLAVGQTGRKSSVTAEWGVGSFGDDQVGELVPLTIAGEHVTGETDAEGRGLSVTIGHSLAGQHLWFSAGCSRDMHRDACVAILQSWRWGSASGLNAVGTRIAVAAGAFSLAVPDGWSDVTATSAVPTVGASGWEHHLVVGPAPDSPQFSVTVVWGSRTFGVNTAGELVALTIDGSLVTGFDDGNLNVPFGRTVDGRFAEFDAACSSGVPRDTCLAILDSWRWDTPSRSRVLPVVAGAAAAVALAGGALVLVVRRRRRTTRP